MLILRIKQNSRRMTRRADNFSGSQNLEQPEVNVHDFQELYADKQNSESSPESSIVSMGNIEQNREQSIYPNNSFDGWALSKQTICLKCHQIESPREETFIEQPFMNIYSKIIVFRRQLLDYYGYEVMDRLFTNEVDPCVQIWKCRRLEQDINSEDYVWVTYCCKMVCFKHEFKQRALYSLNDRLLKDSGILTQLNHKNIVKVHQMIDLNETITGLSFYICSLSDYMEGTLQDLMHSYPKSMKECELISKKWFRQIATGIDYLHNRIHSGIRITHLAINPSNILWRVIDPISDDVVFKVTNFEECIAFESNEPDVYPYMTVADNSYCAPEGLSQGLGKATRPMDVYSLGKLLAINLLKDYNSFQVFRLFCAQPNAWFSGSERRLFTSLSLEVRDLLTDMLWKNPNHRLTAEQVCNHIWLK